jgi:hypothetical protein
MFVDGCGARSPRDPRKESSMLVERSKAGGSPITTAVPSPKRQREQLLPLAFFSIATPDLRFYLQIRDYILNGSWLDSADIRHPSDRELTFDKAFEGGC